MKFGVVIPNHGPFGDRGAIRELIAAAEDLGFDTAWFGDHVVIPDYAKNLSHPNWFDALSCCIFGAGMTSTHFTAAGTGCMGALDAERFLAARELEPA